MPKVPKKRLPPPPPPPPPHRRPPTKESGRWWTELLVADFEAKPKQYLAAIENFSADALEDLFFVVIARQPLDAPLPPVQKGGSLGAWVASTLGRHRDQFPDLSPAFEARAQVKKKKAKERRFLRENVNLFKRPERFAILMGVAHLWVEKLAAPYPPPARWIASNQTLFDKWESYLRNYEQPDKRLPRHPTHLLDPSQIRLSVPAELSCYLYDKNTKELVGVAIRKFCCLATIKAWIRRVIYDSAIDRRSIRLEDPGHLIQVAYSAGSRAAPAFGMVRNFLHKTDPAAQTEINTEIAAIFAYMWCRVRALFPQEVVADFEAFYDQYNIPRFDPNWPTSYAKEATLDLPGSMGSVKLADVERGPGLGVLSQGYARATHYEKQGHLWAASWMANRWGANLMGGHFYLCSYGVEILMDDDTAWGWKPGEWHCTGLSNYEPTFSIPQIPDDDHNQQGIAFVSSARLPRIYAKWAAANDVPGHEKVLGALRELNDPAAVEADELEFGMEEQYE